MTDTQHTTLAALAKHFDTLKDPRCPINRVYPLSSVSVSAIMAILAGANGPAAIAKWDLAKEDFLRQNLPLPFAVPRKDVFRSVLTLLNPKVFQACFSDWLASLRLDALGTQAIAKQIVDGEGDYVLALKGNPGTLHDAVIDYAARPLENDFADVEARQLSVTETGNSAGSNGDAPLHTHARSQRSAAAR